MRQNCFSRLRKDQSGFTLIELVVVVVIIGLLAAVAVPKFIGQKDKAVVAKIAADIKILQNAVDLYYAEKGEYPDPLSDLKADGYLKEVPDDPDENSDTLDEYILNATTHEVEYDDGTTTP